jgi:hypothetical protein
LSAPRADLWARFFQLLTNDKHPGPAEAERFSVDCGFLALGDFRVPIKLGFCHGMGEFMKKLALAMAAVLALLSIAGCGTGVGKGKAPPPVVTKG